jgi:[acyl-carrier-protein] S-malonyltransferase
MNKSALIFPGQGAQYIGMAKDLYENSPEAKCVIDAADRVLGFSLSALMFDGPFDALTKTENCQPAVLTASVAALEVLKVKYPDLRPSYVAGLSLGEYTALVAAGIVGFEDAVYLVRRRGEFMESAAKKNPGKMSCILGLDATLVRKACEKTGCQIANLNCPGQVVVSGTNVQIEAMAAEATDLGAKRAITLDVSGAFHSSLMDEAREKLKIEIEKIVFKKPLVPLVSNVDAQEQMDPEVIKKNLIRQVSAATCWEASMRYLVGQGITEFYEVGPGTVLKGLFKKIDPAIKVVSAGKWEEIQGVKEDLG